MTAVAAAACVVLAAAAVGWPAPGARARRRRLLAAGPHPPAGDRASRPHPEPRSPFRALGQPRNRSQQRRTGRAPQWCGRPWEAAAAARAKLAGSSRRNVLGPLAVAVAVAAGAGFSGGAVAAGVTGAYAGLAVRVHLRRRGERARTRARATLLDATAGAAGDLRAGLPVGAALAAATGATVDPLADRVRAAAALAEQTGAPLAEVLERIEVDARSADRTRAAAGAQAAGTRATAWLLVALPVGGIVLGYLIGADPLAVLLQTPVGAVCAVGAVVLQLAGLAWVSRISRPAPELAT